MKSNKNNMNLGDYIELLKFNDDENNYFCLDKNIINNLQSFVVWKYSWSSDFGSSSICATSMD